jgi:isoquinoline 1-oxidoreductase subunit beta
VNRRTFFRVSAAAAGGLLVSMYFDWPSFAQEAAPMQFPPAAFIHIRPDGRIVVMVNRVEIGQGVGTALPMMLADELDADWSQIDAEMAPTADVYKDPVVRVQMVGGSSSVPNSFAQYRELGARMRALLIAAAADRWRVRPEQCRTEKSVVYGPDNQSARYADLASDAARQTIPEKVRLKDPSEFRIIGTKVRRLDSKAKCDGSQKFGLDLTLPGMLIALLARPPVFGGRVKSFDDRDARSIAGVRDIFEIPLVKGAAVAVVANRFWSAKQARDRLKIDWDLSGVEHADTTDLRAAFKERARTTGIAAVSRGDQNAFDAVAPENRIVADFEFPYLAHASMEPLVMTVRFDGDRAEAWSTSQLPEYDRDGLAAVLGLPKEKVTFRIGAAGGSFGRKGTLDGHLAREAGAIAKRFRGVPVKLVYTREDDTQAGYYRPFVAHRVDVGISSDGTPNAWRQVVVGQSLVIGSKSMWEPILVHNGLELLLVEGSANMPYVIPNFHVSGHHPTPNVPVWSLRSVGYTHNIFVVETLVDELVMRANADPIEYRLKLIGPDEKKAQSALNLLAEKSAWRNNLPSGHACGIAFSDYHGSPLACAADVSIDNGRPRIHRVTVAAACGLAVNPMTIEAQVQGGFVFGVMQVVSKCAITLKDGRVEQGNFDRYGVPYIKDGPMAIDVHIVPSTDAPTGMGECGVPVAAPAVVNALARLTGKRYRTLPLPPTVG